MIISNKQYQGKKKINMPEKNTDILKYEHPSVASDIVVFSIMDDTENNYRKLAPKKLKLLLIKRGIEPFKNMYSLPGGFIRNGETLEKTAERELEEETGIKSAYLKEFKTFSKPGRDPRGWVISDAFLALIASQDVSADLSSDADDAFWFEFSYYISSEKINQNSKISHVTITLRHEDHELISILEISHTTGENSDKIKIIKSDLAFDHAEIIYEGYKELINCTTDSNIAFNLMPEYFTLSSLQKVYEVILGKKEYAANFRRKISDFVIETELENQRAGHRTSKLYKRNPEKF